MSVMSVISHHNYHQNHQYNAHNHHHNHHHHPHNHNDPQTSHEQRSDPTDSKEKQSSASLTDCLTSNLLFIIFVFTSHRLPCSLTKILKNKARNPIYCRAGPASVPTSQVPQPACFFQVRRGPCLSVYRLVPSSSLTFLIITLNS